MDHRRTTGNRFGAARVHTAAGANAPGLPQALVIAGVGSLLGDLIQVIREQAHLSITGIVDPNPMLHGQFIDDIPVLGWLNDIPNHVRNAVIGNPIHAGSFDRASVFQTLKARDFRFPVLRAVASSCDDEVFLPEGTSLLAGCTVMRGAHLGLNVLVGSNCRIKSGVILADHQVVIQHTTRLRGNKPKAALPSADVRTVLAPLNESIQTTMRRMNASGLEIVLVVNEHGTLVGTITDGDIRRGILAGIDLVQPVSQIMNPAPTTIRLGAPAAEMFRIMRDKSIRHLPVVDGKQHPIGLERIETLADDLTECNAVVMAGGLGTRLKPITDALPKPLIPIGGRPLLDHILTRLHAEGVENIVLSLNHLGHQIREHIGDGSRYGTKVDYLTEKKRLGTAGALSLLQPRPRKPFLVMNGDLLTGLSFAKLLQFQREHHYAMVVCVRQHKLQVPYGVAEIRDGQVIALREKPSFQHFINAGIYMLAPSCLEYLPDERYCDMPDLIRLLIANGKRVGAFPIFEYWRDVGTHADLAAAQTELETADQKQMHSMAAAIMGARP